MRTREDTLPRHTMKSVVVVMSVLVGGLGGARAQDAPPVHALLGDPAQLASWLRDRDPLLESARAKLDAAAAPPGRLAYRRARRDVMTAKAAAARKRTALEKTRLDARDLSQAEYARIELDAEQVERARRRAEAELEAALAICSAMLYAAC